MSADPTYITKGAVVGALIGAGVLAAYDRLFPTTHQRERRIVRHLKHKAVALDVDSELMRLFLSLQYYEPSNPEAYEAAFGRIDSVCKIFKLLYTDCTRRAQEYDYSIAFLHYKKGMEALREVYESVRENEFDAYQERAAAQTKLSNDKENRRRLRSGEAPLGGGNSGLATAADKKLAESVLECDGVKTLISSISERTELKLEYINGRVMEYLSSPEYYERGVGSHQEQN